MPENLFTESDLKIIEKEGLTAEEASSQLEILCDGMTPLKLDRPCSIGDGIVVIPDSDREVLISIHNQAAAKGRMTKFVPASGAASRMFRSWFNYYETKDFNDTEEAEFLKKQIPLFAFYDDLTRVVSRDGHDIRNILGEDTRVILEYILTPKGLNYAHLPKALLKFHAYPDHNRTSLEEHLVEATMYVQDYRHICRIYITVSGEHRSAVEDYILSIREYYETGYNIKLEISLSVQLSSTDTIAVDMEDKPFRDEKGGLVFRPGGHGALLKNLNAIEEDIIFVKNIDNIVPDRLKPETVLYKKILGGYLVKLQEEIFHYLRFLNENELNEKQFSGIADFCREKLCAVLPSDFEEFPDTRKKGFVFDMLNRPLRVCGMVRAEGEPGGGPFWVKGKDGAQSLQIVEEAQIDAKSEEQKAIWKSSTYFNPVDLVCGIRDYRGEKFDLERYVDKDTHIVSDKSYEGKFLKVLELPGLWNGSMARWNTVFVEVPLATFNPAKTAEDLLRDEHQGAVIQSGRVPS
ncbi:MAG: DUF4301 family protein [Deltaproteobacteria bacterium]|nr:DUF4301 family protein [Deltaproteobacteria bacterium]MBW2649438.1 DUF4301 family protein [Deltaproteobacteria bacterium]